jgi:hypothetical protein
MPTQYLVTDLPRTITRFPFGVPLVGDADAKFCLGRIERFPFEYDLGSKLAKSESEASPLLSFLYCPPL